MVCSVGSSFSVRTETYESTSSEYEVRDGENAGVRSRDRRNDTERVARVGTIPIDSTGHWEIREASKNSDSNDSLE